MAATPDKKKTTMGMDENVESGLCYVGSFVTGLIFLIGEKNSKKVKFHAWQSIALAVVFFTGWIALAIISAVFWAIDVWPLAVFFNVLIAAGWIGYVIISIIVMIKAFTGSALKLPVIGDFSEKRVQ